MKARIALLVVGLLIDADIVCARLDEDFVILDSHRLYLDRYLRKHGADELDDLTVVVNASMLGRLASHEEDMGEAHVGNSFCLSLHLLHGEYLADYLVLLIEPTVDAVVVAIVREVERLIHAYGLAKALDAELLRFGRHSI